jgi:hypothetical protein
MSYLPYDPWSGADLLFLNNTLRHGMNVEEVAGFLRKTSDEVRAKAEELHAPLSVSGGARQSHRQQLDRSKRRVPLGPPM